MSVDLARYAENADRSIGMTIEAMGRYRAHLILGNREEAEKERQAAHDGLDAFFDHVAAALARKD